MALVDLRTKHQNQARLAAFMNTSLMVTLRNKPPLAFITAALQTSLKRVCYLDKGRQAPTLRRSFVSLVSASATVRKSKNGTTIEGTETPGMIGYDQSGGFYRQLWALAPPGGETQKWRSGGSEESGGRGGLERADSRKSSSFINRLIR